MTDFDTTNLSGDQLQHIRELETEVEDLRKALTLADNLVIHERNRTSAARRELERLHETIDKCRLSAALRRSPAGPSGDVINLLHRGDLAERKVERLLDRLATERKT